MGDFPNLTKNAHEILCPDFSDLFFRIASPDQLTRNIPQLADIITAFQTASTIEISSDPHMVDSDDPDDVIYVVNRIGLSGEPARVLLILQSPFLTCLPLIFVREFAEIPVLLP